jgi:hypothetical protein
MNSIPAPADTLEVVSAQSRSAEEFASITHRHLRFGWWALLLFLSLGLVLESLHGFKIGWYLNVSNQTRRLLWTLAHAHGTLLALVNVIFAVSLPRLTGWSVSRRRLASKCLLSASVLLPAGFLLGGTTIYAGDPGLGILLVPLGALLLLVSVLLTAQGTSATPPRTPASK